MHPIRITLLVAAVVGAAAGVASADQPASDPPAPAPEAAAPAHRTPEQRRSDRKRALHAIAIGGFAAVYLTSEILVKDKLAPAECAWCDPPGFDKSARDALRWAHTGRANLLSNLTGYAAPPFATMGLLIVSSWGTTDKRRWFDDVAPVLEAAVTVSLVNQVTKFLVSRARPFVRFAPPGRTPELDDNLSFFSGHTSLAFSEAVAAGVVAHDRGYKLEPVIWASGLTLAAATGYLRIAADKHYLSDVLVGAVVGSGFGLLVPYMFHADVLGRDVIVVPTANGAAISGTF